MKTLELKVGDFCKVANAGRIFTTYDEFAINAGHTDFEDGRYINQKNYPLAQDRVVRILFIGPHKDELREPVAIVETIEGDSEYFKFMISIGGLVITKEAFVNSIVQAYLSGIPIFKTIPDDYVTSKLIDAIIHKNPMDIQFISSILLKDEHYRQVLCKDGGLLGVIPIRRRTLELCRIAFLEEPYAEKFIPENLRSLVNS